MPKSNGKEKTAKWTNMTAKQSLQHSPDLDPTAPSTSNIPPREASREALHWVKCEGYALRMRQDRRRLAQTCTKFDRPLEPAFVSNKNDKQNCRLTLVGPHLFMVFTVFYAHYSKDHTPKSNGKEKAAKGLPRAQSLPTYFHEKSQESPNIRRNLPIWTKMYPKNAPRSPKICTNML